MQLNCVKFVFCNGMDGRACLACMLPCIPEHYTLCPEEANEQDLIPSAAVYLFLLYTDAILLVGFLLKRLSLGHSRVVEKRPICPAVSEKYNLQESTRLYRFSGEAANGLMSIKI